MHIRRYQNWGRNDLGEMVLGAKRLGYGGETIKGENRGETTWGKVSWGRNDLLQLVAPITNCGPFLFFLKEFHPIKGHRRIVCR